ncbi:uncharacterized protein PFLUO_LOCUS8917 [Penicillium psychrofluorescens]|uniref:uncharacterized protein n=1 Tax=Penicillium psychrofluorescens TaxID=3158075 RepID=UPI003CCE2D08
MAIDPKDPDGDSEMASSVDSIHDDSDAPHVGARTPTGHTLFSPAAGASELSPPGSQPQHMSQFPVCDFEAAPETIGAGAGAAAGKGSEPPVAAWKSRRAQEDYQRAMEYVVDKEFNLNEFGDPFDERDLEQKLL